MSKIVGIDLGTSNSAASVMEAGKPIIIPSAEGTTLGGKAFPSYVAFTKDGQAKADVLAQRDQLYGPHSAKKTARAEITDFKVDPGADGWQKGASVQLDLKTVTAKK